MRYAFLTLLALLCVSACNSVTVVPIDDEDAGDGGSEASPPTIDAATDASADG